jgi:hypothetical protein
MRFLDRVTGSAWFVGNPEVIANFDWPFGAFWRFFGAAGSGGGIAEDVPQGLL